MFCFESSSIENYKMDNINNKFLLARDKFMPETYSACGPFTKIKESLKKSRDTKYIYRN